MLCDHRGVCLGCSCLRNINALEVITVDVFDFRRAIESADTTREEIITDIRTISVLLGAVVAAILLVAIGVIVCARSSAAQRSRMNSALMALFHETNARPAAVEPNFRI